MKQELIDAINKDIEEALNEVEGMEESLKEDPREDLIREKFKSLFDKVVNLEQLLKDEGII
jgi:Mg2+ and Co2+ transporter CorA